VGDDLAVAGDLHLHVAGARQELLHIERPVAERRGGLGGAAFEGFGQFVLAGRRAHAAAAAAGHRLDHHRAVRPKAVQKGPRRLQRGRPVRSRQHRHIALGGQRPGARLVAEEIQRL
jgi:hypothetical protein